MQISPRRGKPSLEAVACVGALAEAIGSDMEPYVRSVLTRTLVTTLEQIASRYVLKLLSFNGC
jgi:FKBP12-rapamycin complex-associated protein